MANNKCACPDCSGNCNYRLRDMEKCTRCGRPKRKFRQCLCEEPLVYTHKSKPSDPRPMYEDD